MLKIPGGPLIVCPRTVVNYFFKFFKFAKIVVSNKKELRDDVNFSFFGVDAI